MISEECPSSVLWQVPSRRSDSNRDSSAPPRTLLSSPCTPPRRNMGASWYGCVHVPAGSSPSSRPSATDLSPLTTPLICRQHSGRVVFSSSSPKPDPGDSHTSRKPHIFDSVWNCFLHWRPRSSLHSHWWENALLRLTLSLSLSLCLSSLYSELWSVLCPLFP